MLATIRLGRRMLDMQATLDANLLVNLLDVNVFLCFHDGIFVVQPILTTMSGIVNTPNCGIAFIPETEDAQIHWWRLLRSYQW